MASDLLRQLQRDLVIANRIFAQQGVLDAFGHVSIRDPDHPEQFIMSRSLAPEQVTEDDLLTFDLEGQELRGDQRTPYGERFIHGAIYEVRPEVQAVCHSHTQSVIPFGVTDVPLRPVFHLGHGIGDTVPIWDIADEFGDTHMLVTDMAKGRSLARTLGSGRVALMRGHGAVVAGKTVQELVFHGVYMDQNARLLTMAHLIGGGKVRTLSPEERRLVDLDHSQPFRYMRSWDAWCAQAGMADES